MVLVVVIDRGGGRCGVGLMIRRGGFWRKKKEKQNLTPRGVGRWEMGVVAVAIRGWSWDFARLLCLWVFCRYLSSLDVIKVFPSQIFRGDDGE